MAKTTGPLLSFSAGGQMAKTMVYSHWRGLPYTRRYVVPANPKTAGQETTRGVFAWLNGVWKLMNSNVQAPWTAFTTGKPLINRNAFIKSNLSTLRTAADLDGIIASPGANGGLPAGSITLTAGTLSIDVTMVEPSLPTDWAITAGIAIAFPAGDPTSSLDYNSYSDVVSSTPFNPTITVPAVGNYQVCGFYKMTKSDGTVAYGPSLTASVDVT